MSFLFRLWGRRTAACTIALFILAPLPATAGKTFKSLYSFQGGNDGVNPFGNLIRDKAGNLYGTTFSGGGTGCGGSGCGVVFKITAAGLESILYTFQGGSDGWGPAPGLYEDSSGNLYGATFYGGGTGCDCGTLFRMSSTGTESILHSFSGGADGGGPGGQLIADKSGNLYGTAETGGFYGYGTIFMLSSSGTLSTIYNFEGGNDGTFPNPGLVADSQGNLYGTTIEGGSFGYGTIFKHAPNGTETELYAFDASYADEIGTPLEAVTLDSAGDVFTPVQGGSYECDIIFEVAADGTASVFYSFTGGDDGCYAFGNLIADSSGNLYGTAEYSGPNGDGTVYTLAPDGTETTLHGFGGKDGNSPSGGLIADSKHHLYGTTDTGGRTNNGTVFRVSE